jgi:hypothetical protein
MPSTLLLACWRLLRLRNCKDATSQLRSDVLQNSLCHTWPKLHLHAYLDSQPERCPAWMRLIRTRLYLSLSHPERLFRRQLESDTFLLTQLCATSLIGWFSVPFQRFRSHHSSSFNSILIHKSWTYLSDGNHSTTTIFSASECVLYSSKMARDPSKTCTLAKSPFPSCVMERY